MSTPTLKASVGRASRLRTIKRRFFLTLLKPVPFGVLVWISRTFVPRLVRYLPAGKSIIISDYVGRYKMKLSTDYSIETMMIGGAYELETRRVVQRLVGPGDHCLDVGANVGAITFMIAERVGVRGRIVAFEPAPSTFARLSNNISLNPGLSDVIAAKQSGVGAERGRMFVVEDDTVVGNATLKESGGIEVPIVALDEVVVDCGWQHLNFVKIDVEGMEAQVFQGARETINRFRPLIYFESMVHNWSDHTVYPFVQIEEQLAPLGYEFLNVHSDGTVSAASSKRHGDNTLAVPSERVAYVRERLAARQ